MHQDESVHNRCCCRAAAAAAIALRLTCSGYCKQVLPFSPAQIIWQNLGSLDSMRAYTIYMNVSPPIKFSPLIHIILLFSSHVRAQGRHLCSLIYSGLPPLQSLVVVRYRVLQCLVGRVRLRSMLPTVFTQVLKQVTKPMEGK